MAGSDMMANLFGADSDEEEDEEYEGGRQEDEDADEQQGGDDNEEESDRNRESDEEEHEKDADVRSDADGDREEDEEEEEARDEDGDPVGNEEQEEREELEDEEDADNEDDRSQRRVVKERPVGPPIELEIPMQPPPGQPTQMNVVKVSNIMGIEMRPFDPDTYEAQDTYIKDESGQTQRVMLDENIVRWRYSKRRDGRSEMESNTRFVKWSDGSMQLFIGSEVLNIAVQQTKGDQSHLFLRHKGGVLQSQGRLFNKMKFMPSSLTSKSHKLLTALVDTKHKKVFKVKKVVTVMDPDKQKDEQEKIVEKRNRAKEELQKKQEKHMRKYTPQERRPAHSNYLEDEDGGGRRRMMVDADEEREAENRILKAKRDTPMSRDRERSLRGSHAMRASMNARLEESEDDEAEEGEASEPETEDEPEDAEDLSDAEAEEEEEVAAAADEEEEEEARSTESEREERCDHSLRNASELRCAAYEVQTAAGYPRCPVSDLLLRPRCPSGSRSHRKDKHEAKGKGIVKRKRQEEEERRPVSRRRVVSDDESD